MSYYLFNREKLLKNAWDKYQRLLSTIEKFRFNKA